MASGLGPRATSNQQDHQQQQQQQLAQALLRVLTGRNTQLQDQGLALLQQQQSVSSRSHCQAGASLWAQVAVHCQQQQQQIRLLRQQHCLNGAQRPPRLRLRRQLRD